MGFESDWAFLRAALPDLQEYILSKDVYWPLRLPGRAPGSIQIPQLTIGNLMLSLARLSAMAPASAAVQAPSPALQSELEKLSAGIQQMRGEWRTNWGYKAAKEYTSRLNLWQQYLRDLRADPRQNISAYPNQVRQRAILDLLNGEVYGGIPPQETNTLQMLDALLRGLAHSAEFAWEPDVTAAFPADRFWYLYIRPKV